MITTNQKHSQELERHGRLLKCYYRITGLYVTDLSVYLPSGYKLTLGFSDEVELKSRLMANHHKKAVRV